MFLQATDSIPSRAFRPSSGAESGSSRLCIRHHEGASCLPLPVAAACGSPLVALFTFCCAGWHQRASAEIEEQDAFFRGAGSGCPIPPPAVAPHPQFQFPLRDHPRGCILIFFVDLIAPSVSYCSSALRMDSPTLSGYLWAVQLLPYK